MSCIITMEKLDFSFILQSKLKHDKPHIFGFPYSACTKWQAAEVAERLVHAGLAKVCERSKKTGKIISLHAVDLQVKHLEQVCLSENDHARIDNWLRRGVR